MYLAYFDESGDDGLAGSPTTYFVLCGVVVADSDWLNVLDSLVLLRRNLKATYAIPARAELKGSDFKRGQGALKGLHLRKGQRWAIYEEVLDYYATLPIKVFSIAVHKLNANGRGWRPPRSAAWTFALQRVHRFCRDEGDRAIVIPDEGHGAFIRRLLRGLRRHNAIRGYYGRAVIHAPTNLIVEDPNDRDSQHSYIVQMADMCAFAAHRSRHVHPMNRVPRTLWDRLKSVHLDDVNKVRGGPPGMVVYP